MMNTDLLHGGGPFYAGVFDFELDGVFEVICESTLLQ